MPDFDKWWNDTKKHSKRLHYWLPHWKAMAAHVAGERAVRYFTLCARPMIDVFMLVKEGVLLLETENYSIEYVQFCESDSDQFLEIRDLIAREDAGFFGRLEEIVLFEDDDFTAQCPTLASIAAKLEDERLQEDYRLLDRLQLKRIFFEVRSSFPYDFVNLDFCDYYYPEPPGMLRINRTVDRILDWQRKHSEDELGIEVQEFILTVTCRHDEQFPGQAETRLAELIRDNCAVSAAYKEEFENSRGAIKIEEWAKTNREDFFFAGWPKDIAHSATQHGWTMEILDYVYYRRVGDERNPYLIACLVAKFSRGKPTEGYVSPSLYALAEENRKFIDHIDRNSPEGRQLLEDLAEIVGVRNEQASRKQRPGLPDP